MSSPPLSPQPTWHEEDRLAVLRRYAILDTPQEPGFDGMVGIAAHICHVPAASITFIDRDRQWFKAVFGFPPGETDLERSLCVHALTEGDLLVIPDASRDPRFAANPAVAGEPHVRFYAGAVMRNPAGLPLGTLCVFDFEPRPGGLTDAQSSALLTLARQVVTLLEHRLSLSRLKEREAALEQSERRFRTIADTMPQIVWSARADGFYDYYNRRWYDFTGLPDDGPEAAFWEDIVHPDDKDRASANWRRALDTGEVYESEKRLRNKAGQYRWSLARAVPIRDAQGTVERWFGTFTDIHERKTAAEGLRESEARYRALVEASAVIIWQAGPDGGIEKSWGWEAFCGQDKAAYRGEGWVGALHPDDGAKALSAWRSASRGDKPCTATFRVRHRDGGHRWVQSRAAPLHGPDGAIQGWIGTMSDIHDQRVGNERLKLRDRSLASIAQGVVISDARLPGYPVIYVNPAFERMCGYGFAEVSGQSCRLLQGPETDLDSVARIRAALHAGKGVRETLTNYRKDGTAFANELTISPVHASNGTLTHFVGVQSDVSERLRLEAQLRQATKMEAVGQLTGGIAHDFNNLLTVILGNAEVLAHDLPGAELGRDLAKDILKAAERGADLVQRLLAFGRRHALKPVRLDLGTVVTDMTSLLRRTIGEHIELQVDAADGGLSALADRSLLESAIVNLAVNARDAMAAGGTLTIRTGQRGAHPGEGQLFTGQDVTFVTVADTGAGMSPEVLSRVFEPFFTTKEPGRGSGLGLSMVYGFAQQSGGHVSIESEVGRGTAVTIVLPAVVGRPASSAPPEVRSGVPRGDERILLVEDEPQVLQFVSAQLVSLGYRVTAVTNAPDALAVLRQGASFDLLLTDVVLPKGMSGVELSRWARTASPGLKVLFTSGYPQEVFASQGIDPGAPVLLKPYKRTMMAETLRSVLD